MAAEAPERHIGIVLLSPESLVDLLGLSRDHKLLDVFRDPERHDPAIRLKVEGPTMPLAIQGETLVRVILQIRIQDDLSQLLRRAMGALSGKEQFAPGGIDAFRERVEAALEGRP